jgi:hypothetical protein
LGLNKGQGISYGKCYIALCGVFKWQEVLSGGGFENGKSIILLSRDGCLVVNSKEFYLVIFAVLEFEPRASWLLSKGSAT